MSTKYAAFFPKDEKNDTGRQNDQPNRPENNADRREILRDKQIDTKNDHVVPPSHAFYTRK
jgi:hypothetical protein